MSSHTTGDAGTDAVARAISRAHGILPDQGPIGVFVHHNTLHAFQHLPFHEAVQQGAGIVGARPYLSLGEFRAAFARGRIELRDVDDAISDHLGAADGERTALGLTRHALWRTLMIEQSEVDDVSGLRFAIAAGTASIGADQPLWEAALSRVSRGPQPPERERAAPRRHRDAFVALGAADTDDVVHAELVRLCAGFLDQGQARDVLPGREEGFLRAIAGLYAAGVRDPRGARGTGEAFGAILRDGRDARSVIQGALDQLSVPEDARESYLLDIALALPGWAGMFSRLERHAEERVAGSDPTLAEFLAVRLVFEAAAVRQAAAKAGLPLAWAALRALVPGRAPRAPEEGALLLWTLARAAGAKPAALTALDDATLGECWRACDSSPPLLRRQLWMEAYEHRYRRQVLDAIAAHRVASPPPKGTGHRTQHRKDVQVLFCIDEREESIRRAIEEQGARFETFGVAGFFGVAIDYQGLYDPSPAAHCPVVVIPGHEVHEAPVPAEQGWHERRLRLRHKWNSFERALGRGSRTLAGGAGLSFVLGPLAGVAAAGRVVAPRSSLALRERFASRFVPRPVTRLSALRDEWQKRASTRGKPVGFSLEESTDRVAAVLRSIGLLAGFAPVIVVLGHGSTSLNNPHESAHDCGACGGRRGGANARLFAELANRADVRGALAARGITIPDDTIFVGGLHDTADDRVQLFDLGAIPASHDDRFEAACVMLEVARRESARERARRFDDAPLGISADDALQHVEARAAHLAQPRPEYGHCTNAICIVGRRELSRGLHLDRRAFLVSYDASTDRDDAVLERILAAVGPVGAGISLEYYFSSVDNLRFGCGTKLPHNVTGLIGVMNGHQGDLQTGLPLQMVELHEPMRLLLIVESTPEALLGIASRQPEVAELVTKEWVQLVAVDPATGAMQVFHRGGFAPYVPAPTTLPEVERSIDWHGRSREFLPPARVRAALGSHA